MRTSLPTIEPFTVILLPLIVLYAPNGNITINGSKITVNGSIVGKEVRINGSRFSVDRTNHPITSLPVDSPNIGAALVN